MQLRSQSVVNFETPAFEVSERLAFPSPTASPSQNEGFEGLKIDFDTLFYNNADYLKIIEHLDRLETQLQQCKSDIDYLQDFKQTTLAEPESFTGFLLSEASRSAFPSPQKIVKIPEIPIVPYRQKLTRRSNVKFEQNLEYLTTRLLLANRQRPLLTPPPETDKSSLSTTKRFFPEIRRQFLKVLDHPVPETLRNPNAQAAVHQPRPRRFTQSATEPFGELPCPPSVPSFAPTPVPSRPSTPLKVQQAKQRIRKASANAPENTWITHNIPWSDDEKRKLEYLLSVYPEEEVQARRYAKIAAALGSRTSNQVASRVQKIQAKSQRKAKNNANNNGNKVEIIVDAETKELVGQLEAFFAASDDPGIKATPEYAEYVRLKRQLEAIAKDPIMGVLHTGYSCDRCGADPIIGPRWTCSSCPKSAPAIDLCDLCISSGYETATHKTFHVFKKFDLAEEVMNDTADSDFLFK